MSQFEKQIAEVLPFVEGKKETDTNGVVSYKVNYEGILTKEKISKLMDLGLETMKRSGAGISMYFKPKN